MLFDSRQPLDEFKGLDGVILEIPESTDAHYEQRVHSLVKRLRRVVSDVSLIVHASGRRHASRATWVHRFNQMPDRPVRFTQTCSCQFTKQDGCHLAYHVASTLDSVPGPCSEVSTERALLPSTLHALRSICAHFCMPATADQMQVTLTSGQPTSRSPPDAQRTPDSFIQQPMSPEDDNTEYKVHGSETLVLLCLLYTSPSPRD